MVATYLCRKSAFGAFIDGSNPSRAAIVEVLPSARRKSAEGYDMVGASGGRQIGSDHRT
jgi:hypothetical protein